ncbi:hypothetical protein [Bdellovibrio bacteriovorus]|uniref:hypothetical protein n=1 Tax=Bdellovibrio bacteriovorus TaxID=959 RepID=UPI0035A93959
MKRAFCKIMNAPKSVDKKPFGKESRSLYVYIKKECSPRKFHYTVLWIASNFITYVVTTSVQKSISSEICNRILYSLLLENFEASMKIFSTGRLSLVTTIAVRVYFKFFFTKPGTLFMVAPLLNFTPT